MKSRSTASPRTQFRIMAHGARMHRQGGLRAEIVEKLFQEFGSEMHVQNKGDMENILYWFSGKRGFDFRRRLEGKTREEIRVELRKWYAAPTQKKLLGALRHPPVEAKPKQNREPSLPVRVRMKTSKKTLSRRKLVPLSNVSLTTWWGVLDKLLKYYPATQRESAFASVETHWIRDRAIFKPSYVSKKFRDRLMMLPRELRDVLVCRFIMKLDVLETQKALRISNDEIEQQTKAALEILMGKNSHSK